MPNYCENDVYFDGPQEVIAEALALMGDDFSFDALLPYPDELRQRDDDARLWEREHGWQKAREMLRKKYGTDHDGYNSGGYDWCIRTWGTKWPALKVERRDLRGKPCVSFKTAWGPPMPVIAELHRRFPKLTISLEYFECGMALCGGVTFQSEEDFYGEDGEAWEPGKPAEQWEGEYRGHRGG